MEMDAAKCHRPNTPRHEPRQAFVGKLLFHVLVLFGLGIVDASPVCLL